MLNKGIENVLQFRLSRKLLVNLELFDRIASSDEIRDVVTRYSWIKPTIKNYDLIESALKEHNANKILDIGCGSGYWTYQLNKMGFDAEGIKTDMFSAKDGVDSINLCDKCRYGDFYEMSDSELCRYDTFYVSWPPYQLPLATDVFKKFLSLDNIKNYVFIGELGGCTGDTELYDLIMDSQFINDNNLKVKEYFELESFSGIHDYLIIVQKKES